MSRNQRIALVVAALAVAAGAFVVAQPADDEPDSSAVTTPAQTETETEADTGAATANPQPTTETEPPPAPVMRIAIAEGAVEGGPKTIEVARGETVHIVVTADAPDEIHLHGYDITRNAGPGQPARFRFKANAEGAFEIESHVAEDAGKDPLVARLVVAPA